MIHKALDSGINFIDTADAYSHGESEEIVGKALKGRRDDVVLATKAFHPMGDDPNQRGSSRRWLTRAVEGSLRRLQTDSIDLYQVHRPAPDTGIEETLSVLTDLLREGKVRDRRVDVPRIRHRGGAVGRRAPRTGPVPHRTAALLHPEPIEREVLPACQRYGMMEWA
jgi:aryl-alcohol dehydrogenase-like predicted oxidoreductase